MRILIAGNFTYPWYEEACATALETLGHEVLRYSWTRFTRLALSRIEMRVGVNGPATHALNRHFLRSVVESSPDVVLVWRGTQILPATLKRMRTRVRALLVSYNNDDPFGPQYGASGWFSSKAKLWRLFRKCIPEYYLNLVFRPVNVQEYERAGANRVEVLLPYFVPSLHRTMVLTDEERVIYACDAVFVGHYEDDGRVECIEALVKAGFSVRVYGANWPLDVVTRIFGRDAGVRPALGDEYAKVLCGATLCLSFHSRLNRDTYTRRTFEIPACEALLVSERTPDVMALFAERSEALYFSSPAELVETVRWVIENGREVSSMRIRAKQRCVRDGHDAEGRMRQMLTWISAAKFQEGD